MLKGEYPVARGLTVGHEPVGVIEELGSAVSGHTVGQRVIAGAITPCGQCHACLGGNQAQCGGKPMGGWRLGNTIDGCQSEYVLIPDATANLAPIPDELTDEQVLMCPDIMSTGLAGEHRRLIGCAADFEIAAAIRQDVRLQRQRSPLRPLPIPGRVLPDGFNVDRSGGPLSRRHWSVPVCSPTEALPNRFKAGVIGRSDNDHFVELKTIIHELVALVSDMSAERHVHMIAF